MWGNNLLAIILWRHEKFRITVIINKLKNTKMVIGGIGYCDIQGNFQFHKNLIEGLQIFNGSLLYGVYHPRPKKSASDRIKYHFMLSPIPYQVWPRTARFIFRLRHETNEEGIPIDGQTEGIQLISDFLHKQNVAIIYSFSNRSAHRYSTWDIHVCFDDIKNEDLINDYDDTKSCYSSVFNRANVIAELIRKKFSLLLFTDEEDIDLTKALVTRVNTSCHYFYYESEKFQIDFPEKKRAYEHFTLRYNNGSFRPNRSGIINEVIHTLEKDNNDFQLQSICFAESDSHYLNLRIIIIPNNLKHKFFKLSIFHERLSDNPSMNNTSKGLLHYITNSLPIKDYKIWKSSTQIFEHRVSGDDSYCNGKLSLFIEAKNDFTDKQANFHKENLETHLQSLNNDYDKPDDLKHIRIKGRCEKVFPDLIKRYFKIENPELTTKPKKFEVKRILTHDVFISYSKANEQYAKDLKELLEQKKFGIKVFLDDARLVGGAELSEHIHEGLVHSREFCLLISNESLESKWVTTEWGAAWALGMYTVPILIGIKYDDLPFKIDSRVTRKKCLDWPSNIRQLESYAKQILSRRFESMLYNDDYDY